MLQGCGVETGVDFAALLDAAAFMEDHLGRPLPGHNLRARRAACATE
jgi:hydroxymethylglutaryl-CoA lyase